MKKILILLFIGLVYLGNSQDTLNIYKDGNLFIAVDSLNNVQHTALAKDVLVKKVYNDTTLYTFYGVDIRGIIDISYLMKEDDTPYNELEWFAFITESLGDGGSSSSWETNANGDLILSAGSKLYFDDSSGNDYIVGSGSNIQLYVSSSSKLFIDNGSIRIRDEFYPFLDLSFTNGKSTNRWSSFYSANITDDGTDIGVESDSKLYLDAVDGAMGDDYIISNGSTVNHYVGATSNLSMTTETIQPAVSLYPTTNNSVVLGIDSRRWEKFYSQHIVDDGTDVTIESDLTIENVLTLTPIASAPSSPSEGMIYSNSTDNHLYFYNGTSWVQLDN